LPKVELRRSNNFDSAQEEILKRLAKEDPKAAVKLMVDAEDYFRGRPPADPLGPFSEPLDPGTNPMLSAFRGIDMRWPVLGSIADTLPDDPAECLVGLRRLTADLGRDASWQQQVEASIFKSKLHTWSTEQCMEAAKQWVGDYQVTAEDETLRKLAERAPEVDTQKALSNLEQFPEAIRATLRCEIIRRLPASEHEQRMQLLGQLPEAMQAASRHGIICSLPASEHERRLELLEQLPLQFWDYSLGETLGKNGEDYTEYVSALPPAKSRKLLSGFANRWAESSPEMAAQWLHAFPDRVASTAVVYSVANRWFYVDADAAAAWVNSLPRDAFRDKAVAGIVNHQANEEPVDAWRWADTITSPQARVEAFDKIASYWYRESPPPEQFQQAHRLARQQLGLPAYQIPPDEEPDPFQ
jgi:hypothetical protein